MKYKTTALKLNILTQLLLLLKSFVFIVVVLLYVQLLSALSHEEI